MITYRFPAIHHLRRLDDGAVLVTCKDEFGSNIQRIARSRLRSLPSVSLVHVFPQPDFTVFMVVGQRGQRGTRDDVFSVLRTHVSPILSVNIELVVLPIRAASFQIAVRLTERVSAQQRETFDKRLITLLNERVGKVNDVSYREPMSLQLFTIERSKPATRTYGRWELELLCLEVCEQSGAYTEDVRYHLKPEEREAIIGESDELAT